MADEKEWLPEDNTDLLPTFNPKSGEYDYRGARLAGVHRGPDGHMQSRDPVTGRQLKGREHPTFDKAIEEDRKAGYGLEMRDGHYYTQPFKPTYEHGGKVTAMNRDATRGQFRTGGPLKEPNFAVGGPRLNVKFSSKGDK